MGVSIGCRFKAVALVLAIGTLFFVVFASSQTTKVEARANLTAYLTVPPTDWYPFGKYVPGTTGFYITHTLGWYNVTAMGNVGIGDGSVRTLNNSSNQDVNYSANNFMAADISTAPWDRSRLTSAPPLYPAPTAVNQTNQTMPVEGNVTSTNTTSTGSTGNISSEMLNISNATIKMPQKISFDVNSWLSSGSGSAGNIGSKGNVSTGVEGNVSENASAAAASNVTPIFSNLRPNVPLNDVYHPILLGRPIDDLYYEYPLASSTTMYARLVGLSMAGGPPINMGIACLGYGY